MGVIGGPNTLARQELDVAERDDMTMIEVVGRIRRILAPARDADPRRRVALAGPGLVQSPASGRGAGAGQPDQHQQQCRAMSEPQRATKRIGKPRVRRLGRVDVPSIVASVLDRHVPPELQRLTRIREIWAELLPRNFTDAVWPMLVQAERLIVHVHDSQWLHEMTYWRQDVLSRLREEWPESGIERLDAFVGELPPLAQRRPAAPVLAPIPVRVPVLASEVPSETVEALNEIRDPRLRDALAQARWILGTRTPR